MHNLSPLQRFHLNYLGRMYFFTFRTKWRRFMGISIGSWLQIAAALVLLVAWIWHLPWWLLIVMLFIFLWIRFSYKRAEKAGYHKFVADKTAVSPTADFDPLQPNERVKLRATGQFALSGRETSVLLRPAEYWKVPLGDHSVMVEESSEQYLYQFFNKTTLENVQTGWLIFGREPMRALSITFCSKWGPAFTDFSRSYYVRGGKQDPPCQLRDITFTFAGDREYAAVRHSILQDLEPG